MAQSSEDDSGGYFSYAHGILLADFFAYLQVCLSMLFALGFRELRRLEVMLLASCVGIRDLRVAYVHGRAFDCPHVAQ